MNSSAKLFLTFILICTSVTSFAQSSPDDLVKKFFEDYKVSPELAIQHIYQTNSWMVRATDAVDQMKNEVKKYTLEYIGQYYGYKLITEKDLSDTFILYSYIVKYDRQPLRFIFEVYKPNDKWVLYGMKIDGNLDDEMEQSAKMEYLNLNKN